MASRFSLETILTLNDQMTATLGNVERGVVRYGRSVRRSMQDLSRPIQNVNRSLNRAFRVTGAVAIGATAAGLAVATREFVRFDEALTQAGAKFGDLDTSAANYQESLDALGAAARAVGAETEFMATDAAGALDKMAMAGMSSELAISLLRGTTDLATASGADLTTAVDIATDAMGAFGLATDDVAQAERNLARVSDVMVATTTSANTSFEQLFEAVRAGAPAFTAAGQSLESFTALAGAMSNAGLKGSEAGTNLRNVMLRLSAPTGEAANVLDALNVQTQDAQGNFRDVIDILADFEKGLEGMGTQQRSAALSTVFGARAVTGVNILLQEGTESLRAYRGELAASAGAATTMAEAMRRSLGNRIEVLKSSLMELGFRFVEAFEEKGRAGLDKLIEGVQNFDPQPVIDFMVGAVEWGGKAFVVLSKIWPVLVGLAVSIKVLAFVTGTLNVALALTPVGIIIAGITAITVATIALIRNWDHVKEWWSGLWSSITDSVASAWAWIEGIIEKIMGAADAVKGFLGMDQTRTVESGRQQNAEQYGLSADMYSNPRTAVAESRSYRESVSRSEVYVRPDRGAAISSTRGGPPEPSLAVGVQ